MKLIRPKDKITARLRVPAAMGTLMTIASILGGCTFPTVSRPEATNIPHPTEQPTENGEGIPAATVESGPSATPAETQPPEPTVASYSVTVHEFADGLGVEGLSDEQRETIAAEIEEVREKASREISALSNPNEASLPALELLRGDGVVLQQSIAFDLETGEYQIYYIVITHNDNPDLIDSIITLDLTGQDNIESIDIIPSPDGVDYVMYSVEHGQFVGCKNGQEAKVYNPSSGEWQEAEVEVEIVEEVPFSMELIVQLEQGVTEQFSEIILNQEGQGALSIILLDALINQGYGSNIEEVAQYLEQNEGWARGVRLPQPQVATNTLGRTVLDGNIEASEPEDINFRLPIIFKFTEKFEVGFDDESNIDPSETMIELDGRRSGVRYFVDESGQLHIHRFTIFLPEDTLQYQEVLITWNIMQSTTMIGTMPPLSRAELIAQGATGSNEADWTIDHSLRAIVHNSLGGTDGGVTGRKNALLALVRRLYPERADQWLNQPFTYTDLTDISRLEEDPTQIDSYIITVQ